MTIFAITYTYPADSPKIAEIRPHHREFLRALKDEGKLIGSGPFTDGDGGALIVISLSDGATIADAESLMDQDPFQQEKALTGRTFQTWNPVLNVFGYEA